MNLTEWIIKKDLTVKQFTEEFVSVIRENFGEHNYNQVIEIVNKGLSPKTNPKPKQMEFKGTKGEWYYDIVSKAVKNKNVHGILATAWSTYKSNEVEIKEEGESWLAMRKRTEHIRDEAELEKEANAKLIAAAPELLEALQQIYVEAFKIGLYGELAEELHKAEKAIQKALK